MAVTVPYVLYKPGFAVPIETWLRGPLRDWAEDLLAPMAKRVNVILPEDTVRTIDRIARPGQRSRFIERAVRHYVATASPAALHERLKAAVLHDRDLDLEIAQDWLAVDQAQWQQLPQPCGCRFRHSMCCCRRIRPQAWLFHRWLSLTRSAPWIAGG